MAANQGIITQETLNQTENNLHLRQKNKKIEMSLSQEYLDVDISSQEGLVEVLMRAISLQRGAYRAENALYASGYRRMLEVLEHTANTEQNIVMKKHEIEEIRRKVQDVSR